MMILAIFLSIWAYAGSPEQEVIAVFDKSRNVYEKFESDTRKYRQETEAFDEKEFIPAVDKMIILLNEKKCQKCLQPYLKGLANLANSANEELYDQLKKIISNYPEPLNNACKHIETKAKKVLDVHFKDAIQILSSEKNVPKNEVEKKINRCVRF